MQRKPRAIRPQVDHQDRLDLDALLHPARAFTHPVNVINDPDLTLSEKRAILASWASDVCAVEAAPALREPSATFVRFDEVMDALRSLDRRPGFAAGYRPRPRYRRILDRRIPGMFGRRSDGDDQGSLLN